MLTVQRFRSTGAIAAAVLVLAAAPASAETGDAALDALTAASRATQAASRTGVDVVQTVRFSQRTRLTDLTGFGTRIYATVPAGTRLRLHSTVDARGAAYLSVRYRPSGRLLAGAGVDPRTAAPWATLRMLYPGVRAEARAAGLSRRTALTGLPADVVLDAAVVEDPARVAAGLILPPYSGAQDEGWTTVETFPQPDGTTVIRGTIRAPVPASEGEDNCTRPLVELTVGPDGVARSSRWTETCPGEGTRTYRAVAVYGPQDVQRPTRPRRAASSVLD